MASESTTLYLKADRNVEVSKQNVMLGDLLSMECSDKTILMKVKSLRILKIREEKEQRYVISVLKIIACIHEQYPRLEIQNLGETDIIVTYENQKITTSSLAHFKSSAGISSDFLWICLLDHGIQ